MSNADIEAVNNERLAAGDDPINRIEWRSADDLQANDYNPNVVFSPELRLLEHSILTTGWVQPVLVGRDGTIIDGFHRWMLSRESAALRARYCGRVPCVVMDVSREAAMLMTVRMNRAKGSHVAVRMAEMVKELIDRHGLSREDIAKGIGATRDEVDLLYQDGVFKARKLAEYRYSKAWYPVETGRRGAGSDGQSTDGKGR